MKEQLLTIIKAARHIHEDKALDAIFPPPAYPQSATPEAVEAWRAAYEADKGLRWGGTGRPYSECFAAQVSAAAIALAAEGRIKSHNNGYCSYTYEFIR